MEKQNTSSRAPQTQQEKEELMRRRQARLAAERGEKPPQPLTPAQKKRLQEQREALKKQKQKQQKQAQKQQAKAQKEAQKKQRQRQAAAKKHAAQTEKMQAAKPVSRSAARRARRRRTVITVCALLSFIVIGAVLSVTVLFKIEGYRVDGESVYTQEQLVAAFGHEPGENMFRFSMENAADMMQQTLPYLESIKVRRRLPGTVVFMVQPAVEYACIDMGDGTAVLLSETLRVLETSSAVRSDLLQIAGYTPANLEKGKLVTCADEEKDEQLKVLIAALKSADMPQVTAVDLSNQYELNITYGGRMIIKLGTSGQLEYKLSVVKKALETGTEDGTFTDSSTGVLDASTAGTVYYRP